MKKLKSNWGAPAETMACKAECRVYLPDTPYEAYIYAMNPQDDETILCIEHDGDILKPDSMLSLWQLLEIFNPYGEYMAIDKSYKPMQALYIYQKLKKFYK